MAGASMREKMTHRQRFQAVLDGKVPDRTPWVARLDLWYKGRQAQGTLPPQVQGKTIREAESYLGMGHSARNALVYRVRYDGLEERSTRNGDYLTHAFITPVGEASCTWYDPTAAQQAGIAKILTEHYIKNERDFEPIRYVAEHMRFVPDYDAYRKYDAEVGDDGYPLTIIGASPIHSIMLTYFGYEQFYYWLSDAPDKIETLLKALEGSYRQMWEVVEESPAKFLLHGVHFNSEMTPPRTFRRFFLPYFTEFNARMHAAGIKVAFHADADLTGLLDLVLKCGFDVADTFACAPLVRCTFDEARAAWKDNIVIWGGVPSIILEPTYPIDEFRRYMKDLHIKTKGTSHFIMAVSDNILPGAEVERLEWIRDLLQGRMW